MFRPTVPQPQGSAHEQDITQEIRNVKFSAVVDALIPM